MKKRKKWTVLASALALTALCVGAAFAANGDQNDPLITLSYLQQTVIPDVVSQVETKSMARQKELEQTFSNQITQYKQDVAGLAGSGSGGGASYTLVTLVSGQTMSLSVGCEVLLRIGTVTVNAATSPALIDVSAGGTINAGTSLTKNHLYMATISDRTLTPTAATVKLLVRGDYSVAG